MDLEPTTKAALVEVQAQLGASSPPLWRPPDRPLMVGACFAIFERGLPGAGAAGDRVWASAVQMEEGRAGDRAVVEGEATAPYEPGLLFLRVGPVLIRALRRLRNIPEILMIDATGRDHPRRAGLALHLGAVLDVPTIGVTHRPLLAQGEWPQGADPASSPLRIDGETVGYWLRTRRGARPLAVHAGWRTDPDTAVALVRTCVRRARTPEPLRIARQLARLARAHSTARHSVPPQTNGETAS